MKTVLVIGSNSFSGSDYIDLLLEMGMYKVIGVSRSKEKKSFLLPYTRHGNENFSFYQIDLNKDMEKLKNILNERQPEFIVNFAAQSEVAPSWKNPDHWFQTNSVALTRLANVLKDCAFLEKYVHISSPEVYGTCSGIVKEDAPLNPSTPYAASKAAGDLSLLTFFKNFNFPLVMVRSTNVYGAHQQLFKIIPRSIINIKLGKKIQLHGGGVAVKSYIHIRDISKGELLIMEKGRVGELYHLSPPQGYSVREVVKLIAEKCGKTFDEVTEAVEERLGQDKAYIIDSSKAQKELGWKPTINLEQGIDQTLDWVNQNFKAIQEESLEYVHQA
ncbi:MAG: dTDP-glucose 4,6-dehydratase [Chlamydiae bacterium]|nr:dTDP-glucose 4,6-dehydratase [Chlamydiota bacterium]